MRNDRLYGGLVLVIIGAAFLLYNFGYINIHWINFIYLWPVLLVVAGINILLGTIKTTWATVLRVLVLVFGFGFILLSQPRNKFQFFKHHFNFRYKDDDDDTDTTDWDTTATRASGSTQVYEQPYSAATKLVRLTISGGATTYKLRDTTAKLFKANVISHYGNYMLNSTQTDSAATVTFDMKGKKDGKNFSWNGDKMNRVMISMNAAPQWIVNVKGGATKMDLDLTSFKIKELNFNGGLTDCEVKLGTLLPVSYVNISAGVSDININVPKNAGCDISTSTALSSNDFKGFTKQDNGHYVTPGFSAATQKIYIKLNGGVADFNVNRY